jgi:hypothetical protein
MMYGGDEKAAGVETIDPHVEPAMESPKHTIRLC